MKTSEVPVSVEFRQGALIATVRSNRLGFDELDSFGAQIMQLAEEHASYRMILDMGPVSALSSIVIGKLFRVRKLLVESGGELVLVASNPSVLHVFKACHLDHILEIHSTVEQAVAESRSAK